jgi:hypothetical protein
LEWLLHDPQVPDANALLAQIPFTQVTDGTPNLPTYLHLSVSEPLPAACEDGALPGGAVVQDASGEPTGFLDLWVKDGYLETVEHSWVTDEMPQEFPSVEHLRRWRPEEIHSGKPRRSN